MILTVTLLGMLTAATNQYVSTSKLVDDHTVKEPVIVTIFGPISDSMAESFEKDMMRAMKTGQYIIPVIISSYGGSVYALNQMIDVINKAKLAKFKVATVCVGKCMSAGAALLTCGSEGLRFAAPNSTIMIHEVSSMTGGKVEEIKTDANETDRLNKLLLETMSLNINKPKNYLLNVIHSKSHADWYLTPQDAVDYNVVNKVGNPDLKVKINVDVTFE